MGYPINSHAANYFSVLSEETSASQDQVDEEVKSPTASQEQRAASGDRLQRDGASEEQDTEAVHVQVASSSPYTPASANHTGYRSSNIASPEGVPSLSSPLSPEHLDFDSLSLGRSAPRGPANNVPRYTAPFQRGLVRHESPHSKQPATRYASNALRYSSTPNARTAGRYNNNNNHTWSSGNSLAQQEFMVIRNAMRRQFKHADVAKWKLSDYIEHREATLASQAKRLAEQSAAMEEDAALQIPPIPEGTQQIMEKWGVYGNFDRTGNLGRVLGERTIWCDDWLNGKDEIAPWPCIAELKWEGDDRAKTGVGRFFPLPREEGPPGLSWNQLPVVDQYPMDQVALIPTMEDVYLPVDAQIEEEKEYLWSKDLQDAMDDFLDS